MKKTLLTLIALSPLMAFSQVVDYEVVNQRNADRINSEYSQTKVKKKSKVREFFKLDNTNFPKKEKYSAIEKDQINLLSCTRDLIQKHKGGYDAPEIAQKILLTAMEGNSLSTNKNVLSKAEDECRDAYKNLYNFKKKAINEDTYIKALRDLSRATVAEEKAANVITKLYVRENIACKAVSIGAEGYVLVGGGAGINSIKCLQSDGRVKKYLGADLRFAVLAFGAAANVSVIGKENIETEAVAAGFVGTRDHDLCDEGFFTAGITKLEEADCNYAMDDSQMITVGAAMALSRYTVGGSLRTFNGKARWGTLLNSLK